MLAAILLSTVSLQSADLARFRQLDLDLGAAAVSEKPMPKVVEAQEILISSVKQIAKGKTLSDEEIAKGLEAFQNAAAANGGGATEFSWVAGAMARNKGILAICVNYGPAGRLAVFDEKTGKKLKLPSAVTWMPFYHPGPVFSSDGTLLLLSELVEDLGIRTQYKVQTLYPVAGKYRLAETKVGTHNIDWGGPGVKDDMLTLAFIDAPKSFSTSNSSTLFQHVQYYSIAKGALKLKQDQKKSPQFRFLDEYIYRAQRSTAPDENQDLVASIAPKNAVLDSYTAKVVDANTTVYTLQFADGSVEFVVKKTKTGYRVASVKEV